MLLHVTALLQVLAVLKQVSAELDAAQRHYLAYKQFGDAGERCAGSHSTQMQLTASKDV